MHCRSATHSPSSSLSRSGCSLITDSLIQAPGLVLATLAIILVGKPLVAFCIVVFLKYPVKTAISVALVLSQIGEFSFILAAMGAELGILPVQAQNILVAAAIISITLNPLLFKSGGGIERWLERHTPVFTGYLRNRSRPLPETPEEPPLPGTPHAVVVGYGPVGRTVTKLLRDNGIVVTVVELNVQTVQTLHAHGIKAIYGDATRIDTLRAAGVGTAGVLVISIPDLREGIGVLKEVRELNPKIRIIARTTYLSEQNELADAGADDIFSDEGEMALSVTELILRESGATPEQIDRERRRVHESLYRASARVGDERG